LAEYVFIISLARAPKTDPFRGLLAHHRLWVNADR